MAQKPEITFEYEETVVLKQGGKLIAAYCPRCAADVDMLSPDVLSLVTGTSEREIFAFVEAGTVHFEDGGRLVVCPACFEKIHR